MARTRVLGWLLVILALAPGCATNGLIRGQLRVPPTAPAAKGSDAPAQKVNVRDAVVYVDSIPERVDQRLAASAAERAVMAQAKHRFSPHVLPVAAGTIVRFENRDRVYQNVFSVSPTKRFDVGKFAPGEWKDVRFDRPGAVQLFCDIDPAMSGYVLVLPHRAFARPDATGTFALPELPRGTYTVRVWHPLLGRLSRKVTMPNRGDAVVKLSY